MVQEIPRLRSRLVVAARRDVVAEVVAAALRAVLQNARPAVAEHLEKVDIISSMYASQWFVRLSFIRIGL